MEKDNKKIDELFRKGLGDPKLDFNEEHWRDMHARLNKRSGRKKAKRIFILAVSSAAAIAALFFIWSRDLFILDQLPKDTDSQIVNSEMNTNRGDELIKEHPTAIDLQEEKMELLSLEDLVEPVFLENDLNTWRRTAFIEVVDSKNSSIQYASSHEVSIPEIKKMRSPMYRLNLSNESFETMAIEPGIPVSETKYVQNLPTKSRSVLSVLAGPDLSSVRGAGSSSLSENVGILYSYPVINRLSVSVGATYAKKNYKSPYSFYSPANPPELTQIPSQVNAECDVIDIPLTANYTVLQNKKVKFNVSAGLSSYFMLKERYTFDYEGSGSYGNKKSAVYEISGENQHIFGVADFSISIEKKVNDKINVGIKPFIKMPLTGIGYGRVDLESKGVTLMLGVTL